jgi:hypothetical protein
MGYRSDVAYVIRFETPEQRDAFVEVVKHRNDEHWTNAINECETNYEEPIITFETEGVKWYDSYDDVKAHHAMLDWAVELYKKASWRRVLVGEDGAEEIHESDDDNNYTLWDYLYTSHSINTEFPALKSTTTTEE